MLVVIAQCSVQALAHVVHGSFSSFLPPKIICQPSAHLWNRLPAPLAGLTLGLALDIAQAFFFCFGGLGLCLAFGLYAVPFLPFSMALSLVCGFTGGAIGLQFCRVDFPKTHEFRLRDPLVFAKGGVAVGAAIGASLERPYESFTSPDRQLLPVLRNCKCPLFLVWLLGPIALFCERSKSMGVASLIEDHAVCLTIRRTCNAAQLLNPKLLARRRSEGQQDS